VVEVPLDAPQEARLLRQQSLKTEHACHDSGVILGDPFTRAYSDPRPLEPTQLGGA